MTTSTRSSSLFGTLLRRYREGAGLSQNDLAERAGLTGQAIGRLERGERRYPYPDTVRRLADALHLGEQEGASLHTAVPRGKTSSPRTEGSLPLPPAPLNDAIRIPGNLPGLPTPLTPLLGRDEDTARVIEMLTSGARLLTLTGPGGMGKTRLALHVATEMRSRFADGAVFVPLAPLSDSRLVLPAVARLLGVRETADITVEHSLGRILRDKHLLVVLDNCEHLLSAAFEIVTLLEACPHLVILATSRSPLRVSGEQEYAVASLALPAFDLAATAEGATTSPAVRLFVERARATGIGFELTETNAAAVTGICRQLEGLPLALELAAPRLKLLSPGALLERLHTLLPFLAGGPDVPARQQTLRATFAWSYGLLDVEEQAVLRRLSVFAGGCTLEAAEAVGGASVTGTSDVLQVLGSLVDQSLLQVVEVAGRPRFAMLETIRTHVQDELRNQGEEADARKAHAGFMVEVIHEIDPLLSGPDQVQWIARLMAEQDNVRAALRWLLDSSQYDALGALLVRLVRFWWISGQMVEARRWADEVLAYGAELPARAHARACFVAGTAAAENGDEAAAGLLMEARVLAHAEGDRLLAAQSQHMEGFVAPVRGEAAWGVALMRQALEIVREVGDAWSIGFCLSGLAALSALLGRLEDAERYGDEYLAIAEHMGDLLGVARAKDCQALIALMQDDLDRTAPLLRESMSIARDVEQPQLIARGLTGQAVVVSRTDPTRAACYFGAADALRQAAGVAVWQVRSPLYDQALEMVRAALGPEAFDAAWLAGRAMTREQAVAWVLEGDLTSSHRAMRRGSRTTATRARDVSRRSPPPHS